MFTLTYWPKLKARDFRPTHFPTLAIVICGTIFWIACPATSGTELPRSLAKLEQVLGTIQSKYLERVSLERLTNAAITGMLEQLDPFSSYQTKAHSSGFVAKFDSGVKLSVGMDAWFHDGMLEVWSVDRTGSAAKAGILPGDEIRGINGQTADALGDDEVEAILNPIANDYATREAQLILKIYRDHSGQEKLYAMHYDTLQAAKVAQGCVVHDSIGCIRFDDFHKGTVTEVEDLLMQFKSRGIRHFVLDLRNNTGGYVGVAFALADELVGRRDLRLTVLPTNGERYEATHNDMLEGSALIVLIGPSSASAAELFAGMLQDEDRAIIVGMPSYGKAMVMQNLKLLDGSAMLLVTGRCYLPSGRFIQRTYREHEYTDPGAPFRVELDNLDHGHDREFIRSDTCYHTLHGRKVYGKQGVIPDYIVPDMPCRALGDERTSSNIFYECSREIVRDRGEEIAKHFTAESIYTIPIKDHVLIALVQKAALQHNVEISEGRIALDLPRIRQAVIYWIARRFFNHVEWISRLTNADHTFARAITHFDDAQTFAAAR